MSAIYREEFASAGQFLQATIRAAGDPSGADRRLTTHAATGLSETIGSDGGFLVPETFAQQLWAKTFETGSILARCDQRPVTRGDGYVAPAVDERSRANGSRTGGVTLSWIGNDGLQIPASKPTFGALKFSLKKLAGLAYATDELVADAPALESWLTAMFAREAAFCIEDEIVNGKGVGRPLGVLNSSSLIVVGAESGQASGSFVTPNIAKMWARLPPSSRPTACWTCSTDVEAALGQMFSAVKNNAGSETVGGVVLPAVTYCPPGSPGNPGVHATMMGLPVLPAEYTPQIGSQGDLVLADFGKYVIAAREPNVVSSIHVRFLESETAFRFTFRTDGQPGWSSPLTQRNSTSTVSPFITLAARP